MIVAQPEEIGSWRRKVRVALRCMSQAESLLEQGLAPVVTHEGGKRKKGQCKEHSWRIHIQTPVPSMYVHTKKTAF